MIKIAKENYITSMSGENKPVCTAPSGSVVIFETYDCFTNQIASEAQKASLIDRSKINPATGPLFVEGAEVGDTLKVEILAIQIADQGVMAISPVRGGLADEITEEVTKIIPIEAGEAIFNDKVKLPVVPMIGVIGTAPEAGDVPTSTPGTHGSNMDCKKIVAGASLYLPVNVAGGLLAMGDLHAVMGDGEVVICGLEIPGAVTVRVSVIKGEPYPLPFLVDQHHVMTIAAADTLDEAGSLAIKRMHGFLAGEVGMDLHEAAMYLSLGGDLKVCQIVNPKKTMRMEVPLSLLKDYQYQLI